MLILNIKFADYLLIYLNANPFNNPLVIHKDYKLIRMDISMTEVPFDHNVTQIIYTVYTIAYIYDLRYVILHYKKNSSIQHKILQGHSFISIIEYCTRRSQRSLSLQELS